MFVEKHITTHWKFCYKFIKHENILYLLICINNMKKFNSKTIWLVFDVYYCIIVYSVLLYIAICIWKNQYYILNKYHKYNK